MNGVFQDAEIERSRHSLALSVQGDVPGGSSGLDSCMLTGEQREIPAFLQVAQSNEKGLPDLGLKGQTR